MSHNSDLPNAEYSLPASGADAGVDSIPRHVAIIMDGNGRWAERQGLPRKAGHRRGVSNIRQVVELLAQRGIRVVTLYAFSTENWRRPNDEVDSLMAILAEEIEPQTRELHKAGVRLVHLGDMNPLDPALQDAIRQAQAITEHNAGITVNIAFNYGGRDEILQAVRRMLADGVLPDDVDESLFARYLYTDGCPDPDLIIRTGGEQRLSNFLIWQAAYSEYYHTPALWPDLDAAELDRALSAYGQRQRRFGSLAVQDHPSGA
ncbi:MAG: polyprenyl diphosphate synthase [Chloroflexi bacterium]|nr:polyprenyl diphosphate synthase [Chloroflexota bacterium]